MSEQTVEEIAAERAEPRIADDLADLVVPASELRTHPKNARRGDRRAIAESLLRFGQLKPVVANAEGTIVGGNHLYLAATEDLGWDRIAAVRQEMSQADEEAFLIADNRISELGGWDNDALGSLISEVRSTDLSGTGYSESQVDALMRSIAPEPPTVWPVVDPEAGGEEFQCPKCKFEWSGRPRSDRAEP